MWISARATDLWLIVELNDDVLLYEGLTKVGDEESDEVDDVLRARWDVTAQLRVVHFAQRRPIGVHT